MAEQTFTSFEKTADNPTVVGTTDSGQRVGFETPEQFTGSGGDFNKVNTVSSLGSFLPYSQFKITPSATVTSTDLSKAVTSGDINSVLADNAKNYASKISALDLNSPINTELMTARKGYNKVNENLNKLEAEGFQRAADLRGAPGEVPQAVVGRQLNALERELAYRELPLSHQLEAAAANVNSLQENRNNLLQQFQLEIQNGQFNANLAMQIKQAEAAEGRAAMEFAVTNGITKPFFRVGTTIYNTNGKPYATPEAFFKDAGISSWAEATKKGLIQDTFNSGKNTTFTKIGQHADEYGNMVDDYGFVDTSSGTITPAKGSSLSVGPGNTNFGEKVGEISGLAAYNTEAANPGMVRANRNNNPGNIKVSDYTKAFDGVVGVESKAAADGGNFLVFESPAAGMAAVGRLLQEGRSYQGVTAEQAIRAYSGGGYGAADVGLQPAVAFQSQIKNPVSLSNVVQGILKREGYNPAVAGNVENTNVQTANITRAAQQLLSSSKLDSKDRIAIQRNVEDLVKNGDIKGAADALITTAIDTLDAAPKERMQGFYDAIKNIEDIQAATDEYIAKGGDINLLSGTAEQVAQKVGQTTNADLAYIATRIQVATFAFINSFSGAAFTDSERAQYVATFPAITNVDSLFDAKVSGVVDTFKSNIESRLGTKLGNTNYKNLMDIVTSDDARYQDFLKTQTADAGGGDITSSYADSVMKGMIGPNPVAARGTTAPGAPIPRVQTVTAPKSSMSALEKINSFIYGK